jgi:hypothetical protein
MGRVLRHRGLHEEARHLEHEDRHHEQQADDQRELGQRAAALVTNEDSHSAVHDHFP